MNAPKDMQQTNGTIVELVPRSTDAAQAPTHPPVARQIPVRPFIQTSGEEENRNLDYYKEQDLNDIAVISWLHTVDRVYMLAALVIVFGAIYTIRFGFPGVGPIKTHMQELELLAFRSLLFATLATAVYWEVWRRRFFLYVDGFTLKLKKGVFTTKIVSVPMTPFLSVYVRQTPFEFLFHRYTCEMFTINAPSGNLLKIPGLKKKRALALKDFVAQQVNRTGKVANAAVEAEATLTKASQRKAIR